ncbi:heterokaryon incompatibility protein [Colletotrichum abscissum]|uniref:heterokaryon incompatibility protein n=1 Tax=Colletotrichum abscissum TaxID=1671311 RepID=UPI0027D485FB|nr:heterokaryon incompatibility protein [Colletotrichum abscissum]KAK1486173.1 heterokaryon incompatibility protein [Colletotrichum abscissum]
MDMPSTMSHSHGTEPMPVIFHTKMATALFSESWTPRTPGQYAGTCLALIVFTIVLRTLIAFKPMLEATVWAGEYEKSHSRVVEETARKERSSPPTTRSIFLRVAHGAYEVIIALLGYLFCNDLADGRSKEAERHPEQARGPSSSRVLVHHATWTSFEDAVAAGCHLCTSIHEELVAERLIPDSQPDTARLDVEASSIIQDSVDDWRKESITMAEVYRNGVINIAATTASGGNDGLYFKPHPIHSRHLRISFTQPIDGTSPEETGNGERSNVVEFGDYFLLNSKIWQRGVEEAPLNTRGWVLQERLFSPRVVHFSRHQLFWQCGMDYRIGQFAYSNDRIGSFGKAYTNRDPRAFSQVLWRLKGMAKEKKDPFILEEAYLPWEEVVTTYTAQHLTKGEDKLIAVQALAKAMEEAVDDCYVAGLWESRLVEDLLWVCSAPGERATYSRQTTWRAPTWSWASIDGGAVKKATLTGRYAGRKVFEGEALVKSIKHYVEGYDGVTTGQLKSARLQLEGCLLKSAISWEGEAVLSDGHVKGIGMRSLDPRIRTFIVCPDEWTWDGNGKHNYQLPAGSILLPIGTHPAYKAAGTDPSPCIEGLVLHDAGRKGSLSFYRAGYFKLVAEGTIINACLAGKAGALFARHESASGDGTFALNLF